MVPTTSAANTAIQAPASRGAEPCVATTVTSTASSRASRDVTTFMGRFRVKWKNRSGRVTTSSE